MTVKEYNQEFLPKLERAEEFIRLFESAIRHMDEKIVDKNEVRRHFELRCYSEETKETILTALRYYKKYEGLDKIERMETCKTCKTCKHSKSKVVWRTCNYYDAPDTDYQDTVYICDLDGSEYFGMQKCKFYEPKPIKVKVKKCKKII